MRIRRVKANNKCPFCGKIVDKTDVDSDFMIRDTKYLKDRKQYFHKTCYQRFYSVRGESK